MIKICCSRFIQFNHIKYIIYCNRYTIYFKDINTKDYMYIIILSLVILLIHKMEDKIRANVSHCITMSSCI